MFWLLMISVVLYVMFGAGDTTQKKRDSLLDQFQNERNSRVIAMIHRQESRSILGVPVSSSIDIEIPRRYCARFVSRRMISPSI
jgi:hypothetical protein